MKTKLPDENFESIDESPDDIELEQQEETRSGLQSDDEEWQQELTGVRPDNGYLPGQRMAERGINDEEASLNP